MPIFDTSLAGRAAGMEGAKTTATTALPLRTHGLTLRRDDTVLIDNVDLALPARGITVLMGPNGAGKSLLLRLLHGLIAPSGGQILWGGVALDQTVRRRQAMVSQKPVLLRRSVAANLDFVLRARGQRDRMRRDALLRHVGLEDRRNQSARSLSGGEQQRLALARALALQPDVLLLDEPTASLDPASTLKIEQIVTRTGAQGCKIILTTHDLGQAKRLADDVAFLHQGRLIEHAPAARFFAEPASDAAHAFLEGRLVL